MPSALVLFMVGTGMVLTLVVELVVLHGDIGRMNTVFKFYLQVWTLFAVSAAAALGWLLGPLRRWQPGWRCTWKKLWPAGARGCLVPGYAGHGQDQGSHELL